MHQKCIYTSTNWYDASIASLLTGVCLLPPSIMLFGGGLQGAELPQALQARSAEQGAGNRRDQLLQELGERHVREAIPREVQLRHLEKHGERVQDAMSSE